MDNGIGIGKGIVRAFVGGVYIFPAMIMKEAWPEGYNIWKKFTFGEEPPEENKQAAPKKQPSVTSIDDIDNTNLEIDDIAPPQKTRAPQEQEAVVEVPEKEAANIIVQFFGSIKTIGEVSSRVRLMWELLKHPQTSDNCKNTIVAEMNQREDILRQIAQNHFTQGGERAMGLLDDFFQYVDNYAKSGEKQQQITAIAAQLKDEKEKNAQNNIAARREYDNQMTK